MRRWTGLLSIIAVAAVALAAAVPASARDRGDYRHDQRRIAREYHDLQRQRAELDRAYAWRDRALWSGDYHGAARAERRIREEWRDVREARRDLREAWRDAGRDDHWHHRPGGWSR